jgi:hypothetical protein
MNLLRVEKREISTLLSRVPEFWSVCVRSFGRDRKKCASCRLYNQNPDQCVGLTAEDIIVCPLCAIIIIIIIIIINKNDYIVDASICVKRGIARCSYNSIQEFSSCHYAGNEYNRLLHLYIHMGM